MDFTSLIYLLAFLPAVVAVYYVLPLRWRKAALALVSIVFYLNVRPIFGAMLAWVIVASYLAVRYFMSTPRRNKWQMAAWLAFVFVPMAFFKFRESVFTLWLPNSPLALVRPFSLLLPIGLSCYTLQAVGYVIDVYRGTIKGERSFVTHSLFVSFFPTVLSGPIQRAGALMPQLRHEVGHWDYDLAVEGVKRIIWGLFLKMAVADRMAAYLNTVLGNAEQYNSFTMLVALTMLALQIYTDFAGYSHLAIGTGALLGVRMSENFRRPLFAVGLKELWSRWHISLSSWLRDYVYIPLGGNRCSRVRVCFNTIVTFIASGMWHGVLPSYVLWGVAHGIAVTFERFVPVNRLKRHFATHIVGSVVTVMMMGIIFAFFRTSLDEALNILRTLVMGDKSGGLIFHDPSNSVPLFIVSWLAFACVLCRDLYDEYAAPRLQSWQRGRGVAQMAFYVGVVLLLLAVGILDQDTRSFIYMRF